jgi:hypothetical protein
VISSTARYSRSHVAVLLSVKRLNCALDRGSYGVVEGYSIRANASRKNITEGAVGAVVNLHNTRCVAPDPHIGGVAQAA